jgi:hypothetical protein
MEDSGDGLREDTVPAILHALQDDAEAHAAFIDGLSKRIYLLSIEPGVENQERLVRFVHGWAIDAALGRSRSWRRQVEESEARIASRDLGAPVDGAGLRALLVPTAVGGSSRGYRTRSSSPTGRT